MQTAVKTDTISRDELLEIVQKALQDKAYGPFDEIVKIEVMNVADQTDRFSQGWSTDGAYPGCIVGQLFKGQHLDPFGFVLGTQYRHAGLAFTSACRSAGLKLGATYEVID